jgi:hypothetical protein
VSRLHTHSHTHTFAFVVTVRSFDVSFLGAHDWPMRVKARCSLSRCNTSEALYSSCCQNLLFHRESAQLFGSNKYLSDRTRRTRSIAHQMRGCEPYAGRIVADLMNTKVSCFTYSQAVSFSDVSLVTMRLAHRSNAPSNRAHRIVFCTSQ